MRRLTILAAMIMVAGYGAFQLSRSTTFMIAGDIIARVETDRPRIALTFDDGPAPKHLQDVLDTLAAEDVPATFFLVGRDVETHPDLVALIAEAGHEIGNHSYSHPRMVLMSMGRIADEIERTDAAIRAAGYTGPIPFRPPYGKKLVMLPLYLSQHGRAAIMWDIDPDSDPALMEWVDAYAAHVISNTQNGSIILMHVMFDGNSQQRDALPIVLRGLKTRGFEFVTVSALTATDN